MKGGCQEQGFVLLIVLVAVLLIISISALAIHQSLIDARLAFTTGKTNELFVAADTPLAILKDGRILTSNQGILDKLILYHQNLPDETDAIIAHLCYDPVLGEGSLEASKMVIAPALLACQEGQVRLWLSLWADKMGVGDFSHLPSGVAVDDMQMKDGENILNYHLTIHSLATKRRLEGGCSRDPMYAKRCLRDGGVAHQMLVQEFYYGHE